MPHQIIKLNFDPTTGFKATGPTVADGHIKAQLNDTLEWTCDDKDVTEVLVHLGGNGTFDPITYWAAPNSGPSSGPVTVKKDTPPHTRAWCGYVYKGQIYGYPKDKNYGHDIDL